MSVRMNGGLVQAGVSNSADVMLNAAKHLVSQARCFAALSMT
jgi:hypothetical protein